jgi:hypothetical protein
MGMVGKRNKYSTAKHSPVKTLPVNRNAGNIAKNTHKIERKNQQISM